MQRAWVVLLAGSLGCGFHAAASGSADDSGPTIDAPVGPGPGSGSDGSIAANETCFKLVDTTNKINWSVCTTVMLGSPAHFTANTTIDTGSSANPNGMGCLAIDMQINDKQDGSVCAVFATSITIDKSATISASGSRPLALFAHLIDIEGTVDVASHNGGQVGANSNVVGCNLVTAQAQAGGGAGGTYGTAGGAGGTFMSMVNTGGTPAGTISGSLRGGCDGGAGGNGMPGGMAPGGAGGGAVWISSDTDNLTLGSQAVINASGAGAKAVSVDKNGGPGGGSGGTIVLQAPAFQRDPAAQIYANGGGGAGGGGGGKDGGDAKMVNSGNDGGSGNSSSDGGDGARGSNSAAMAGGGGDQGGGGGGGGAGFVFAASADQLGNSNVYPNPMQLTP